MNLSKDIKVKGFFSNKVFIFIFLIVLFFLIYLLFLYVFLYRTVRNNSSEIKMFSNKDNPNISLEEEKWTLENFSFKYLGKPLLLDDNLQIYKDKYSEFNSAHKYTYKTGTVINGLLSDSNGNTYDLKNYEKYNLIYSCNTVQLLYSKSQPIQFLIGSDFCEPNSVRPDGWDGTNSFITSEIGTGRAIQFININSNISQSIFNDFFDSEYLIQSESTKIVFQSVGNIYNPQYLSKNKLVIPEAMPSDIQIYMVESDQILEFVGFSPEGFPHIYEYVLPFPREDGTDYNITISLLNGEETTNIYSAPDLLDCFSLSTDQTSLNNLTVIGTAVDGSNIYIKKDTNDQYLKDLFQKYLEDDSSNIYNGIKEDDETPLKYDEFIKLYPVIYWQTPFNKIIRLGRKQIFPPYVCEDMN